MTIAEGIEIIEGDSLATMTGMDADSVDTVITDPPYGLSFMGKDWDHGVPGVAFWQAALRVAKPGAMMLAFGGTRTHHRLMCAIEDAGWEIRDCIMWMYGSGFPKSLDISKAIDKAKGAKREVVGRRMDRAATLKQDMRGGRFVGGGEVQIDLSAITAPATDLAQQWNGWGTALKPAWEPVVVAMKPCDVTFAQNAEKWGVAGLNVDGGRIATKDKLGGGMVSMGRPKVSKGWDRPWMHDAEITTGKKAESANKVALAEAQGRWPANVILDEEAGAMLDEQSGYSKSSPRKGGDYRRASATDFRMSEGRSSYLADSGGASRFFYCAKASRSERTCGGKVDNKHPTVKPLELMEYLCKLTATPTGGIVLDPFMGSGTTGIAAWNTGRRFVGIEKDSESFRTAEERLKATIGTWI